MPSDVTNTYNFLLVADNYDSFHAITQEREELFKNHNRESMEAMESQISGISGADRYFEGGRLAYRKDNIGIIKIAGILVSEGDWWDIYMGRVPYGYIIEAAQAFGADPEIDSILLHMNTPGGEMRGVDEAFKVLSEIEKPIDTLGMGSICSAGYYLASATNNIYATPMTVVGSVGVLAQIPAKADNELITIVAEQSPNKVHTGAAKIAHLQKQINNFAKLMLEDISLGRGVSVDTITAEYGGGDIFLAEEALEKGMIEKIMFFSTYTKKGGGLMTPEELKMKHPALYAQVKSEGIAEGKEGAQTPTPTAETPATPVQAAAPVAPQEPVTLGGDLQAGMASLMAIATDAKTDAQRNEGTKVFGESIASGKDIAVAEAAAYKAMFALVETNTPQPAEPTHGKRAAAMAADMGNTSIETAPSGEGDGGGDENLSEWDKSAKELAEAGVEGYNIKEAPLG